LFARLSCRDYIVAMRAAPVLAAAAATLLFTGCGEESHTDVDVYLAEWAIGVSPEVMKAGRVRFTVGNQGSRQGKYLLIRSLTETPPGKLLLSHYQEGMAASFLVNP
jgi:hypothetical protein